METMQSIKETHALQLNDDVFTTESPVTHENSSTIDTDIYSIPWIFLIVLLYYACNFCTVLDICIDHQTIDEKIKCL